ncbi:MAG: DNA-directed RNA polymerase subunit alpha [Candidatus Pacebacteria bacterium]|nr:DNA-directed RNA polymerase subunit alpha [Candidatus Paceibacterota bacterium]PIR64059.1 MAG: DNA-directed RNA polymerase subunit alpha [Candidatus Pacebacteria bacterium CG10_big_fil_rev_8_21_14_0_10_40_26]PIZ78163.1 MAG: DNA-directed RNA polymerase subunit alpha [Candidatus Pacebacteria bacterium CG_4_10_14_0_2_um_filter_40_20]PJA69135.1 MAG: DNA-directed RNA polymerase subunit alpha [Candidatus Pacebacteria bacterium CG_4_9_14_3_um_filter_40_12]PJC41732.1 MAG: DNA-directed RNA polymerase
MSTDLQANPAMSPTFQISESESSNTHAVITLNPLEQGYGHTLGNALRRVLLTSLPGSAISSMRVEGAEHLYSTVEGVSEDVLQISLNVKQIRVHSSVEGATKMRLSVAGPATVTAADIQAEAGLEVINTDQVIATVADKHTLEIEMTVETGMGYVVADEKKAEAIGDIMLDALYSPVIKVSYKVEQTRVGRRTDFDKLVLDIETDGTLSPLDALQQSARILAQQFTQVFEPVVVKVEAPVEALSPEEKEVLRLTVEELDLPTRIANALRKGGFETVGDLVGVPQITISKVKNLGGKSVGVINEALQKKGVSLGE